MKFKRIILACVAMFAIGTTVTAQPDQPRREKPDKEEMIQHRTERMVKKYGLNEAQQKKLLALNTQYAERMKPMRGRHHRHHGHGPKPGEGDVRRPEMTQEQRDKMEQHRQQRQAVMEAYDKELQGIMTAEQFEKYKADAKRHPKK